jgi:protein tyrosine phosphatase (PTP) superfamily phosphohydrolase (DUF442 family)
MTADRILGVLLLAVLAGCHVRAEPPTANLPPAAKSGQAKSDGEPAAQQARPVKIEKLEAKHLPNLVRVHERVISGGLPEGEAAFAELKALGIQTVISVDGAKPDVATAQKYGLRYVHLPHGYDGVPQERAKELAKAVRDLPGPIYLHCHRGKHRSPTAAAVACVGAGLIGPEDAATVLKVAGTSQTYRGLYQSVADAHPLDKALLDELRAEFPPVAKLPALAEAMVEIEHVHDRLEAIESAGWKTPAGLPGLFPDHEALLLREQFTELLRTKELQARPEKFQRLAQEAEAAALALENALTESADPKTASKLFLAVSKNCQACHTAFRDVPLGEK